MLGKISAVTYGHNRQGFGCGVDLSVAAAGMIGVSVCDYGAGDWTKRVDVEIARDAVNPFGADIDPLARSKGD